MPFLFFSKIKAKYFMYLNKKPIPNERERYFIVAYCISFLDFFCLLMFYESQTLSHGWQKITHNIYVLYFDFIQSSSSNHWIKINLDLKWNLSSKMLLCTF